MHNILFISMNINSITASIQTISKWYKLIHQHILSWSWFKFLGTWFKCKTNITESRRLQKWDVFRWLIRLPNVLVKEMWIKYGNYFLKSFIEMMRNLKFITIMKIVGLITLDTQVKNLFLKSNECIWKCGFHLIYQR